MAPLDEVLWQCFRHFVNLDHANASIHMAPVRYSPITFRLAEHLHEMNACAGLAVRERMLSEVVDHLGAYAEDTGR